MNEDNWVILRLALAVFAIASAVATFGHWLGEQAAMKHCENREFFYCLNGCDAMNGTATQCIKICEELNNDFKSYCYYH